jgi:glycosyltransferase involved in cell wall biosynthesis
MSQYNSTDSIRFLPPVFKDNKKRKLFEDYDFLVLPSKSENFGMVILESLACGLPVLTTTNTPWQTIRRQNAGWIINDNYFNLILALKKIFILKLREFNIKSNNAINLAKNYKTNIIIKKYLKVYVKLLKNNN